MVTHDLRMCKYVDKVIQMVDGKVARVITSPEEIDLLAGTSKFDILDTASVTTNGNRTPQKAFQVVNSIPVYASADWGEIFHFAHLS